MMILVPLLGPLSSSLYILQREYKVGEGDFHPDNLSNQIVNAAQLLKLALVHGHVGRCHCIQSERQHLPQLAIL